MKGCRTAWGNGYGFRAFHKRAHAAFATTRAVEASPAAEGLRRTPGERDRVYFVIDSDDTDEVSRVYEADLNGP